MFIASKDVVKDILLLNSTTTALILGNFLPAFLENLGPATSDTRNVSTLQNHLN